MDKTRQILETLRMQPLSEEEKAARHILGRLYGPIATCKENTRNGRRYNRDLWEKALADDIFQEKIANKSLFLELGHPADREETDMKLVCACIPEMPKIVDGDLYAYVDILDTDNGRLLKTLCDYGFVPGISSRGSGDIMENDEVDPETFFLETWDIVQLPAVKKARLQVCESLDQEELKLRKALVESFNGADADGKTAMKTALDNLELHYLDESLNEAVLPGGTPDDISLIPDSEIKEGASATETLQEDEETEETPAEEAEETAAEEAAVEETDAEDPNAPETTVGDFIGMFDSYDKDMALEIKNITIEDKEYVPDMSFDDSVEGKLIVDINCTPVEDSDNKEEANADETAEDKVEDESEEAADSGDEEVIESLKEAIRQKAILEKEVKELRNKQTVSDAEVKELQESLEKYKTAFARTSELAAKSSSFEKEIKSLKEELSKKEATIQTLKETADSAKQLTESMQNDSNKVKTLTEKLASMQSESEANEKALREQVTQYRQKLAERTALAKQYKAKVASMLEKYIASKASMLGVRTTDITSRLNEGYDMDDIDKVCDDLLTESVNITKLPFGVDRKARVQESVARKPVTPDDGYELDDSLFELAGLDKKDY